jgi:peptidoglycan L-alanyl-D-glutamate endopeptidase CwlK
MSFELSHQSLVNLQGVHPELVRLVMRTLQSSPLDFAIIQGLRTQQEEQEDIAKGLSETSHSRHLTGHAIDFMAFVDGKGTWDEQAYRTIAESFRQAAAELGIAINWGGAWAIRLDQAVSANAAYNAYVTSRLAAGAKPFCDFDHIQLDPVVYPDPPAEAVPA